MVCGFVDKKSAGVVLVAVPAAEVVRTVARGKQPFEVDAGDLPDHTAFDDLLDFGIARRIAVVECNDHIFSGALLGVDDLLTLFRIDGHGFFGDDIAAELHGAADVFVVCAVHARDDDFVGFELRNHPVEILRLVSRKRRNAEFFLETVVPVIHTGLIRVTEPDQLAGVLEIAAKRIQIHGTASAGSNLHILLSCHFWKILPVFEVSVKIL